MSTSRVSTEFQTICQKVEAGQRLSADEGRLLFEPEVDLHAVGRLADEVRRRKNGDVVYYNVNAHLNPTNVCVYRCRLCAYSCDMSSPEAYVLDDEAMLARGREAVDAGATELHIVGGLHPERGYDWYLGIVRMLHAAYPSLHLKTFSAVEIVRFAELSGKPIETVLRELREAGLSSLPGGGAEIFDPAVRRQICSKKADAQTWLDVHRTAHRLGVRSNATILFGHVETPAQRIDHLIRLRELQDETGGFQALVPLSFHPAGTALADLTRTSALDELRTTAVCRLMLDNFDHIKAYWVSLGIGTAQVALAYGADDLDGTVRHEEIHHRAGADSPEILSVAQLRRLIHEAGRLPIERDSLYRPVGTR